MQLRFFTHRLLPALLLSIFATICFSMLQQSKASAHAFVIGSDPIDGSTLERAPKVVRIFFNAPISPISVAKVYAISPDGQLLNVSAAHSSIASSDVYELDTPLRMPDQLPQGGYEVRWTALADGDGHTTFGLIGFNIGHSSTGFSGVSTLGPSSSNDVQGVQTLGLLSVLTIAWERLVLIALTFWVGILVIERFILRGMERDSALVAQAQRQALPMQRLCLAGLLVGEVVLLLLYAIRATHAFNDGYIDFGMLGPLLTQTTYGHLWLVRAALLLLALGLLWWTSRPRTAILEAPQPVRGSGPLVAEITREQRTPNGLTKEEGKSYSAAQVQQGYTFAWIVLASLIILMQALTSDETQVAQLHVSTIVFDWLYLAAQCIWFGGLGYLGFLLLPLTLRSDSAEGMLSLFLRRFTPLILCSAGVLLISWLFLGESSLSNTQQLLSDPYGRTLLVKSILIASIVLLGAYTLLILGFKFTRQTVLLPVVDAELPTRRTRLFALEQTEQRMKQLLNIQAAVCAAILLCAAFMTFYAPPIVFPNITYTDSIASTSAQTTQTQRADNLSLTLQLLPGRVDASNTLVVIINDLNDKPVTDAHVYFTITMTAMNMGTTRITVQGGNPIYAASFPKGRVFSMAGLWDIELVVQRPRQAPVKAFFQVMIM
ncbi:MAG: copper resistance protein CopC [Chloroflexi bacterium]|nr:copper resistance protein CopC [Chloroflexota bacterium]